MPSDVRAGRFYTIRRFGSDAVELQDDELHAILPLASVRVFLLGPKGSFAAGGPFCDRRSTARSSSPPPQDFPQALRGAGVETLAGVRQDREVRQAALLKDWPELLSETIKESNNKQHQHAKPNVFFLKYASADILVEIIAELYADSELRIAIVPRLNAVVVQCEPKVLEQIGQLIEALDRQAVHDPEEPAEVPTLRAYDIKDTDAETVFQVLQTLLAGYSDVRLSVDTKANRIIALGRTTVHETIRATIKELESSD